MGKSSKPLKWLVHPSLEAWPEIQELLAKGHVVHFAFPTSTPECPAGTTVTLADYDVALGPNCWRMGRETRKYLKETLAAARKVRYPKEKPDETP